MALDILVNISSTVDNAFQYFIKGNTFGSFIFIRHLNIFSSSIVYTIIIIVNGSEKRRLNKYYVMMPPKWWCLCMLNGENGKWMSLRLIFRAFIFLLYNVSLVYGIDVYKLAPHFVKTIKWWSGIMVSEFRIQKRSDEDKEKHLTDSPFNMLWKQRKILLK